MHRKMYLNTLRQLEVGLSEPDTKRVIETGGEVRTNLIPQLKRMHKQIAFVSVNLVQILSMARNYCMNA